MNKKVLIIIISLVLVLGGSITAVLIISHNKNVEKQKKQDLFTENITKIKKDEPVDFIEEVVNSSDSLIKEEKSEVNESKLKNTFVKLTDFIFYGGEIKGHTFKELREDAKNKVISLWEKLDSKISSKYPNYKENIKDTASNTYSNIKDKANSLKEQILEKYKEKVGEDSYNDTVDQFNEDKENMKEYTEPYIEKGKEAAEKVKEKASEIYENAKDKLSNWYQNYKENNN